MDRREYKLQCVVTHKGGHDSGHYECFRRHDVWPAPFSTPHPPSPGGTIPGNSAISVTPSVTQFICETGEARNSVSESNGSVSPIAPISPSLSVAAQSADDRLSSPTSLQTPISATPTRAESPPQSSPSPTPSKSDIELKKKKKIKKNNKWWRISDDKTKEAKTDDVLSQQKEVYLLFYERVREGQ